MSKRSEKALDSYTPTKKPKHWSLGLLESMKDPHCIIKENINIVVIQDNLLEEFNKLFAEVKTEHQNYTLRAGFHAVPSMQRMHMHVISNDMLSPCLKTKIHWNSFTTDFFIPLQDIIKELKEKGSIKKISPDLHKKLLATPLQCNQCSIKPKNMPELKDHLKSHYCN